MAVNVQLRTTLSVAVCSLLLLPPFLLLPPIYGLAECWDEYPAWWTPIGEGIFDDNVMHSYQGFIAGDLWGNGTQACVGAYAHGQQGLWLHMKNSSSQWHRTPLHPDFFGDNYYCMKIAIGYDLDLDGYLELITGVDKVEYPPQVNNRRWAGGIWVDMTPQGPGADKVVVHPLVWGEWAVNLGGAILPIPVDPAFVGPGNTLPGVLIAAGDGEEWRVFFLEQPPCGFEKVDYRYNSSTTMMEEPYAEPAFYVKQLYEDLGNGMYRELAWRPGDQAGLGASQCTGCWPTALDFNGDGYLDLAVTAHYLDAHGNLLKTQVEFYQRTPNNPSHEYVFTRTQTLSYTTFGLSVGKAINLDGDPSTGHNGREAIIMGLNTGYRPPWWSAQTYTPPGPVIFKPTGSGSTFQMLQLSGAPLDWNSYPYFGTGWLCEVADVDGDGFEDAIMTLKSMRGDREVQSLYIWINPNTHGTPTGGFTYSDAYAKLVLQEQAISHTCQLCDADMDGQQEFLVSSVVRNRYGGGEGCAKFSYYLDLDQDWSQFGAYHAPYTPTWPLIILGLAVILVMVVVAVVAVRRHKRAGDTRR